jgi:hypothetical protein
MAELTEAQIEAYRERLLELKETIEAAVQAMVKCTGSSGNLLAM